MLLDSRKRTLELASDLSDEQMIGPQLRIVNPGEAPPSPRRANLDGRLLGLVDVAAFPDGDGAFGCRRIMGNVWEWRADDFGPCPGFVPDPYREYS